MRRTSFIGWVALLLASPSVAFAQYATTVGSSPVQTGVNRLGANMDHHTFYGSQQMHHNLIFSNPGFEPQQAAYILVCGSGSTTTAIKDANPYATFPANWWAGAQATFMDGTNKGTAVTITANTAANATASTFTYSPATSSACAANGYVNIQLASAPLLPLGRNAGGGGWYAESSGGGTTTYETTDVADGSASALFTAPAGGVASLAQFFDTLGPNSYLILPGTHTYNLTFKAKAKSGTSPAVSALIQRQSFGTYYSGNTPITTSWATYSVPVTINETAAHPGDVLSVQISTSGTETIELDDVAFNESTGDLLTNPTVLRDEVEQRVQSFTPGSMRFMDSGPTFGCFDPDTTFFAPDNTRRSCIEGGGNSVDNGYEGYGLMDMVTMALANNSDLWFTIPITTSPAKAAEYIEFLAGSCSGTPAAGAVQRCALGVATPPVQSFAAAGNQIHLEYANEPWNTAQGGANYGLNSNTYASAANAAFTAMRAAPDYSANAATFDLVAAGFVAGGTGAGSWNYQVATGTKSGSTNLANTLDFAPYSFNKFTDKSSALNEFGAMYAEIENFWGQGSCSGANCGEVSGLTSYIKGVGLKPATYEINVGCYDTISSFAQTDVNGACAGIGAATSVGLDMMEGMNAGVVSQNMFALPVYQNAMSVFSSTTSNAQSNPNNLNAPTWGIVEDMGGQTNLSRPQGLELQLLNSGIYQGGNLYPVTISGAPTYSTPAAQPDPTASGAMTIGANSAVPTLRGFAGANTAGTQHSLIIFNTSVSNTSYAVGPFTNGPTGTVSVQSLTGALTANNDAATTTTGPVALSSVSTLTNPTSINIPPGTTVMTWGTNAAPVAAAAPVPGVAKNNYSAPFNTGWSSTTPGFAITWGYGASKGACTPNTALASGGTIYVAASEYLCAYATAPGYTQSPTTYVAYTMGSTALPSTPSIMGGNYPGTQSLTLTNDTTLPAGTTANPVKRLQTYYSTDGSPPDATSTPYTVGSTISISASQTLRTISYIIGVEQLNRSGAVTNWKRPDCASPGTATCTTDGPGGSGLPTANSDPTGAAGTGPGQSGLLTSGCHSNGGAGPCLSVYQTPQSGVQTNVLWAPSSAVGRCDHCTYMLGDHWIKYGNNSNLASAHENDNYIWDLTDKLNLQGSGQYCEYGCPGGSADLDVGGNASSAWIATGLKPLLPNGVFNHVVKLEHWVLSEITTKPCSTKAGVAWPCIYWDKYNVNGKVGNLQAPGMCGQTNGCVIPAEALSFSVGYVADQYQIDAKTSSPASIQDIVDSVNFTALYAPSTVRTDAYTIGATVPVAATPTASVNPGSYIEAQNITLSDITASAVIHYTTDGSTPTSSSPVYSSPITVGAGTTTINAIAVASGYTNSAVGSFTYTVTLQSDLPTFSPDTGTYPGPQLVTMASTTPGAVLYYTTDGSTPTSASTQYTGPVTVAVSETLSAIAIAPGYSNSPVYSAPYIIQPPLAATPTISPGSESFFNSTLVTIACSTPSSLIYYTLDGSAPTNASSVYSSSIAVGTTETINAICEASGYGNSSVATATYTQNTAPNAPTGTQLSPGVTLNGVTIQ